MLEMIARPRTNIVLDSALELADNGLRLVPCNGKIATLLDWQNKASTDRDTVSRRFSDGQNIAIATGADSGIVVLDVDGPEGLASLATFGITPEDTLSVETGNGFHLYFQHSGFNVSNSASRIGRGLDIRGDGGYVMAPSSIHPDTGKTYAWHNAERFDWSLVKPIPPQLLAPIKNGTRRDERAAKQETVSKGGRNVYLTSVGGSMRKRGLGYAAIRAALRIDNIERCKPPLLESEVDRIAQSVSEMPGGDMLLLDNQHTEVVNADALVLHHGGNIQYVDKLNHWLVYDGQRYREDRSKNARMQGAVKEMLEARYLAAYSITAADPGHTLAETQDTFRKKIREMQNKRSIDNTIDLARSVSGVTIQPGDLDADRWLLNLPNGTLDLNADPIAIRPNDPADYITKLAAVAFDADATCLRWDDFVFQVFDGDLELIAYVQRALGYLLTGDTTEQSFWIAYGGGANGKSTLLNTILAVLGEYGMTTGFNTFDADHKNQYGNDIAALKGSRFAFASESERDRVLAEARIKAITGGEDWWGRFLYGEFFTFTPHFKVWLAVNHKPTIRGADRGIWRRVKVIPFSQNFEDRDDKGLRGKLSEELPGILNWMLAGLVD